MRIEIQRSRPTQPRDAPLVLWRFVIGLPLLAIECIPISKLGAALIGAAALLVVPSLFYHALKSTWSRRKYAKTPGAVIDDNGVVLYGDGGSSTYYWMFWRDAFLSTLDGRPIIQDLHINDINTEGYGRYSSYVLSAVDHLDCSPEDVLKAIQSHPKYLSLEEASRVNA